MAIRDAKQEQKTGRRVTFVVMAFIMGIMLLLLSALLLSELGLIPKH
jgi:hypothetical protein